MGGRAAVLYNYNLCGLCWKIFLNILVLNIHGKTEHIGRNLNVKIVTRLLILVKTSGSRHYRPTPSSAYGIHLYPYPYPHPYPYPYPYIGYGYGYGYGCVSGYGYGYGYGCVSVDVYVYHRPNLELACNVGCRLFWILIINLFFSYKEPYRFLSHLHSIQLQECYGFLLDSRPFLYDNNRTKRISLTFILTVGTLVTVLHFSQYKI